MTTTSKLVKAFHKVFKEAPVASFFIPVNPVPASRPRVSKWGTYYGKNYTRWRKEVKAFLEQYKHDSTNLTEHLYVVVENYVVRPKTTKKLWPRGDVDNYAKAPLDAITSHMNIWSDDDVIISLLITKQFANTEDQAGTQVTIYKEDGI